MCRPQLKPSVEIHDYQSKNPCRGECVSGLFALFCDDIDENANCPEGGSCCITNSSPHDGPSSSSPMVTTTTTTTVPSTTTTRRPLTSYPPQSSYPKCPGFCLLNLMAAFCEKPSVSVFFSTDYKKGSL